MLDVIIRPRIIKRIQILWIEMKEDYYYGYFTLNILYVFTHCTFKFWIHKHPQANLF